jgi:hypothetical protein
MRHATNRETAKQAGCLYAIYAKQATGNKNEVGRFFS